MTKEADQARRMPAGENQDSVLAMGLSIRRAFLTHMSARQRHDGSWQDSEAEEGKPVEQVRQQQHTGNHPPERVDAAESGGERTGAENVE